MEKDIDYVRLVERARLGDKECHERLVKLAQESLCDDVYRMTLDHDLTQDIVQETILEMLKILGELQEADRFWPWLYKIALNKVRQHRRLQKRRSTVPISAMPDLQEQKNGREALSESAAKELKQIIFQAMRRLKPQHRAVLTMRCYKEMDYSMIAQAMGCTEFSARKTFWRAKKALQKQLSRQGFGKGSLLMVLVLFGKMTAPSEAAAAQVSVTAAATKVGLGATFLAMASSKTAVLSLTTAGALAVGTMVVTSGSDRTMAVRDKGSAGNSAVAGQVSRASRAIEECWYYFPENASGPVMMRVMKSDPQRKQSYCAWRQNEQANYYFDKRKNTIYINNYRMWQKDLRVQRLPTDELKLTEFLSKVEGQRDELQYVPGRGEGLLVITGRGVKEGSNHSQLIRHYYILDQEYFRYNWPAGAKTVDNRDTMHKRGWTYFNITGQINEDEVSGVGQIPFVYAASWANKPWLRLKVAGRLKIVDSGAEALVYDGRGKVLASYQAGSFFKGLARPWMGLHTIDTVRRDAAEQQVWFETKYTPKDNKAQVILTCGQAKLVYTIDMQNDVIERIRFSAGDGHQADLRFSYLQDIEGIGHEFVEPTVTRSHGSKRRASPGMLWLLQLVNREL